MLRNLVSDIESIFGLDESQQKIYTALQSILSEDIDHEEFESNHYCLRVMMCGEMSEIGMLLQDQILSFLKSVSVNNPRVLSFDFESIKYKRVAQGIFEMSINLSSLVDSVSLKEWLKIEFCKVEIEKISMASVSTLTTSKKK